MRVQTSGAKIFSSHAAAPTDKPLLDSDPNLYEIQKAQKPSIEFMQAVSLHPHLFTIHSQVPDN